MLGEAYSSRNAHANEVRFAGVRWATAGFDMAAVVLVPKTRDSG
jgi:hypothetical protein